MIEPEPHFIFGSPEVKVRAINEQLIAEFGAPTRNLIVEIADPVERDPMHGIIAAAVSGWNTAIINQTNAQKDTIMSDTQSSYIQTNDVPAFLAEHAAERA